MIIALAVLLAIVLTATTLLALMASCAAVYLWLTRARALSHVQYLTVTGYTLMNEKAVLLERQSQQQFSFGKQSSVLH